MFTAKQLSLAALTSFGALAATASAGMTGVPPFSGPGATFQCWDFPTPSAPTPADPGYINPFGLPQMLPSSGATWQGTQFGKSGVWELDTDAAGVSDSLNFRIPNMEDPNKRKLISVEIKYFGVPGTNFLPPLVAGEGVGAPPEPIVFSGFTTRPASNDPNWTVGTWTGSLEHCPLFETIRVAANPGTSAPTIIDWVCVGTICVPTPGAGALAMAGAALLGARRRRG